jgi:hypothetical protein
METPLAAQIYNSKAGLIVGEWLKCEGGRLLLLII